MNHEVDVQRRFGGIVRLYGQQAFAVFQAAHVVVVGVGGVGSWVVEALARSGIGRLTLIDLDNVAESNINRQLAALDSTLGLAKVEVLRRRVHDINPHCQVNPVEDFISVENIGEYFGASHAPLDFVVDCIDNFRVKAHLITHCRRNKINIVTVGGAGGQIDPGQIQLSDLARTIHDPLLAKVRNLLRADYGFTRNPKRKFDVPCVYSTEQLRYPTEQGGVCQQKPSGTSGLNCGSGFGSATHITATFGFFAVSHVLRKLSAR
ncbi:MAG: tRNA cyclic N6-threonylcarbamoyladenosine(37) synthase TcdA [bacterium]